LVTGDLSYTKNVHSNELNSRLGASITFADESRQHTGSFKFRAAFNLASKVPQMHIIASSSGNFGQAAVLTEPDQFKGKNVCCVISGGNVDQERFDALVGGS
jgi:threonine dehydratase